MTTSQTATAPPIPGSTTVPEFLERIAEALAPECECMLCDLPLANVHDPVTWRLTWDFNRAPAVVHGQDSMLMCQHCLHQWLSDPDGHGGDPVRYYPI